MKQPSHKDYANRPLTQRDRDAAPRHEIDPEEEISKPYLVPTPPRKARATMPPPVAEQLYLLTKAHNEVAKQAFEQRNIDVVIHALRMEQREDNRETRETLTALTKLMAKTEEAVNSFALPTLRRLEDRLHAAQDQIDELKHFHSLLKARTETAELRLEGVTRDLEKERAMAAGAERLKKKQIGLIVTLAGVVGAIASQLAEIVKLFR